MKVHIPMVSLYLPHINTQIHTHTFTTIYIHTSPQVYTHSCIHILTYMHTEMCTGTYKHMYIKIIVNIACVAFILFYLFFFLVFLRQGFFVGLDLTFAQQVTSNSQRSASDS